jgi:hypothetical protein
MREKYYLFLDECGDQNIANLVAYPITRHILDEKAVNLSFDIIKSNIYTRDAKLYGIKVFPKR